MRLPYAYRSCKDWPVRLPLALSGRKDWPVILPLATSGLKDRTLRLPVSSSENEGERTAYVRKLNANFEDDSR